MINQLFKTLSKKSSINTKHDTLKSFVQEDDYSLLLIGEGSLDEVLTFLNKERPITSSNKDFYVRHIVSQIHSQLDETNILSIVANSIYPTTKHLFIKGIDLPNDTKTQNNFYFIQSISDMFKIDVSVKTKSGSYIETKYKGDLING